MEFISSHGTKSMGLPFSDAVRTGDVLHLSGQIGNLPGRLELVPGGLGPETRQMMENIARVLNSEGLSFDNVFKCTVMLADMSRWAEFNEIYISYFNSGRLPARSAFGASALALGAAVEMECCAWMGT
jgi:2-iminobutanoate/2-iminopropanoate deaminase